ncbi:DNA replication and checkpoint protein-domain-containing protein [Phaeosphaeriaceae sp. PMI808]|nr:DNA replication and checkpoint protein-domain-containing protein [Phaeosphaeriaceae sp. PMI808]
MSITELEERCNVLRNHLKTWEKKFASENNGRKAGRDDIKADEDISNKYKEYNKLRGKLNARAAPQTPSKRTTSRHTTDDVERTPKGLPKPLLLTPLKRKREVEPALDNIPQSPEFLSPQGPNVIGPTPQRDGIVLGLFDSLPAGTPSKSRAALADVELNVLQTPSRKAQEAGSEASLELGARGERTPLSTGKRFMLNQFVTPKKRRLDDQGTPSSTLRGLATPAFLRRGNMLGQIDETDETTPRPAPWKRRGLGRSLSSMIQAMRKDEDDRLDEEADIMRELEMEEAGISMPRKPKAPEIQVEDSQAPMPLGPDRGFESENEENNEPELGPDGKPRRVWKKKGLKRQTRRVIMRPTLGKPKPEPTLQVQDDSEDEAQPTADAENELGSDDDSSDYASDASHTPRKRKVQKKKATTAKDQPKEGTVKKVTRKIKATAHANYRRLNIKNKGGNGGKGKFGRRRHRTFEGYEVPWRPERVFAHDPPPRSFRTGSRQAAPKLPVAAPHTTTISPTPRIPALTASPTSTNKANKASNSLSPQEMAEKELQTALQQLHQSLQSHNYQHSTSLLSKAKIALLSINALIPQEKSTRKHLQLARETLELGAIISIRLKDTVSFTRYFQQLQPFYSLPSSKLPEDGGNSSKITGLYLLLLLSEGDYAGFHTLLETLEVAAAQDGKKLEDDQFIQYPIRLEQALMEGSYDRVWGETKKERVPSEEFGLFTEILIGTIRKEIASCSERAYPSIPVSDAKSLLFLDSEGSVVTFAKECGWVVKDSRIYFPQQEDDYLGKDIMVTSDQVIENTLGYARELETIV